MAIRQVFLIAAGFLLGYILFNGCNGAIFGSNQTDTVKVDIDTLIVEKDTTIFRQGKDIFHERIIVDSIPNFQFIHDTVRIFQDFLAANRYIDTLNLPDSAGFVIITDTITQNTIKGRQYDAQVKKSIITKTITIADKKRNSLMVGASINQGMIPEISMLYGGKKNLYYKVGYSTLGINAGIYYKLQFNANTKMLRFAR